MALKSPRGQHRRRGIERHRELRTCTFLDSPLDRSEHHRPFDLGNSEYVESALATAQHAFVAQQQHAFQESLQIETGAHTSADGPALKIEFSHAAVPVFLLVVVITLEHVQELAVSDDPTMVTDVPKVLDRQVREDFEPAVVEWRILELWHPYPKRDVDCHRAVAMKVKPTKNGLCDQAPTPELRDNKRIAGVRLPASKVLQGTGPNLISAAIAHDPTPFGIALGYGVWFAGVGEVTGTPQTPFVGPQLAASIEEIEIDRADPIRRGGLADNELNLGLIESGKVDRIVIDPATEIYRHPFRTSGMPRCLDVFPRRPRSAPRSHRSHQRSRIGRRGRARCPAW